MFFWYECPHRQCCLSKRKSCLCPVWKQRRAFRCVCTRGFWTCVFGLQPAFVPKINGGIYAVNKGMFVHQYFKPKKGYQRLLYGASCKRVLPWLSNIPRQMRKTNSSFREVALRVTTSAHDKWRNKFLRGVQVNQAKICWQRRSIFHWFCAHRQPQIPDFYPPSDKSQVAFCFKFTGT